MQHYILLFYHTSVMMCVSSIRLSMQELLALLLMVCGGQLQSGTYQLQLSNVTVQISFTWFQHTLPPFPSLSLLTWSHTHVHNVNQITVCMYLRHLYSYMILRVDDTMYCLHWWYTMCPVNLPCGLLTECTKNRATCILHWTTIRSCILPSLTW